MRNKRIAGLYGFSSARREFLAGLLRAGFSLGAAVYMGDFVFANERRRKPLDVAYDYIIVGSGSAGSVLASRLSEAGYKTLLVEAGSGDIAQPKIVNSADWMDNLGTETDWGIPISAQQRLENRTLVASAGKVLGGSGSINAMFWLRPDVRDLYRLSQPFGGSWSTDDYYRAFARVERFVSGNSPNRSGDGKIVVGRYSPANPLSHASIGAANELGIETKDHNASHFIDGSGFADVNIEPSGARSGPAQTYIADALDRANFEVLTSAFVTQVVVEGGSCRGIEFLVGDELHRFSASRDVVLCAGAFGSPRILMHSGIGRERQLKQIGIEVKRHLPAVGNNLQDHVFVIGLSYTAGTQYVDDIALGKVATHTFVSTAGAHEPPDVQIMCMQVPFPPAAIPSGRGFSLLPWVAKVESRGSLSLVSSDPRSSVVADPAYLASRKDREIMLRAIETAIAVGESNALRGYIESPVFSRTALSTPEGRWNFIQKNAIPGLHFVGSCRVGSDPRDSVVDKSFKVWGVENLRIVDGSVLPEVPGVNPQATILTIAEIAATMIIGTNRLFSNAHQGNRAYKETSYVHGNQIAAAQ